MKKFSCHKISEKTFVIIGTLETVNIDLTNDAEKKAIENKMHIVAIATDNNNNVYKIHRKLKTTENGQIDETIAIASEQ